MACVICSQFFSKYDSENRADLDIRKRMIRMWRKVSGIRASTYLHRCGLISHSLNLSFAPVDPQAYLSRLFVRPPPCAYQVRRRRFPNRSSGKIPFSEENVSNGSPHWALMNINWSIGPTRGADLIQLRRNKYLSRFYTDAMDSVFREGEPYYFSLLVTRFQHSLTVRSLRIYRSVPCGNYSKWRVTLRVDNPILK